MAENLVETLLETSELDCQVLLTNEREGDQLSLPRPVEFVFYAPDIETAEFASRFITDSRYADSVEIAASDDRFRLLVTIEMPVRHPILCSISAFMACLADIFEIEYDGWSGELRPGPAKK